MLDHRVDIAVLRLQPMQPFLHRGAQFLIGQFQITKYGISTGFRTLEHPEHHQTRRIRLDAAIHMPIHAGGVRRPCGAQARVSGRGVGDVDL